MTQATDAAPKAKPDLKLNYTHEAMADLIIQDPTVTKEELAQVFGLTVGWVSRVIYSDSFQSYLHQRKEKLLDPVIARSLNERLGSVAFQALDIVSSKLQTEEGASLAEGALGLAVAGLNSFGKAK